MTAVGRSDRDKPPESAPADGTAGRCGFRRAGGRGLSILSGQGGRRRCGHDGQELPAARQFLLPGPVGSEAAVAPAPEAGRHDLEQRAAQDRRGRQLPGLGGPPGRVSFGAEADAPVAHNDQARSGERHPRGVAAEVLQPLLRTTPGRPSLNAPGAVLHLAQDRRPGRVLSPRGARPHEAEPVLGPPPAQPRELLAPQDLTEGLDGNQVRGEYKASPTGRQSARRGSALGISFAPLRC